MKRLQVAWPAGGPRAYLTSRSRHLCGWGCGDVGSVGVRGGATADLGRLRSRSHHGRTAGHRSRTGVPPPPRAEWGSPPHPCRAGSGSPEPAGGWTTQRAGAAGSRSWGPGEARPPPPARGGKHSSWLCVHSRSAALPLKEPLRRRGGPGGRATPVHAALGAPQAQVLPFSWDPTPAAQAHGELRDVSLSPRRARRCPSCPEHRLQACPQAPQSPRQGSLLSPDPPNSNGGAEHTAGTPS